MEKKKKKEISIVLFLLLAVALMTVGFAAYTQTLNINGTVKVKGNPWNVHFKTGDNSITESPNSQVASASSLTNTDFSFTVTLNKPGDFYEATVKVINEGSMEAILKSINITPLSADQQKYLTYTVKYNTEDAVSATTSKSVSLPASGEHTVVVRVQYIQPASATDLPATEQTVTISGNLYYESAT